MAPDENARNRIEDQATCCEIAFALVHWVSTGQQLWPRLIASDQIQVEHLQEAVNCRILDRNVWSWIKLWPDS